MPALETVNLYLALATLATQVITLGLLAAFLLRKRIAACAEILASVRSWGLWAALLLALGASAMTLIHTAVYNLPPCSLCWWQRIFLYPQVVLFALALMVRDKTVALYSIVLSAIGLGFALYHHVLQMAPAGTIPCPADVSISCSQILLLEFGYITYPMMGATIFAFLIVLMLIVRSGQSE
jgi:disulfide bond formation protein DsbB